MSWQSRFPSSGITGLPHLFLQMSLKFEFFRRHKLERAMTHKSMPSYIGTESCLETPELSKLDALSAFTLGSASKL